MNEAEEKAMLLEWIEVGKAANRLYLSKFKESVDEDKMVSKENLVAAMTAMAGSVSCFIRAISNDAMPVDRVRDLLVESIDSFLKGS